MEIPAFSYFLFWATISIVFTRLGFNALNKTDLSSSVSPLFMSFFKHSLAISAGISSLSAFVFYPRSKISVNRFLALHAVLLLTIVYYSVGSSAYWYFSIFALHNLFNSFLIVHEPSLASSRPSPDCEFLCGIIIQLVVGSSAVLVGNRTRFFTCTVLGIIVFVAFSCLAFFENRSLSGWLPLADREKKILSALMKNKKGKLIRFAVAMVGAVLFQNYFKLKSLDHVVAFLYFAVAWLANLSLTRGYGDLGIFDFLLSNVMVGCTVSQFGLRGTTWIVYAASLLLFALRIKLESLSFVHTDEEVEVIVLGKVGVHSYVSFDNIQNLA